MQKLSEQNEVESSLIPDVRVHRQTGTECTVEQQMCFPVQTHNMHN